MTGYYVKGYDHHMNRTAKDVDLHWGVFTSFEAVEEYMNSIGALKDEDIVPEEEDEYVEFATMINDLGEYSVYYVSKVSFDVMY